MFRSIILSVMRILLHDTNIAKVYRYFLSKLFMKNCVIIENSSSSCRVCNGAQPPHNSTLHFRNIVSVRSLPEKSAGRHNVAEIKCGCAAHTVFALPVAPQMFRCRGGGCLDSDTSVNIIEN